jgi:TonB family protein
MQARTAPQGVVTTEALPLLPLIIFSLIFHALVLVVLPLVTHLLWNPTQFVRPQTFTLVRMPQTLVQPQQQIKKPESPAAKPKASPTKKAVPAKADKKAAVHPKKQEETENVDELSELLGGISAPISEIVPSASNFKYQWYINNLMAKVERFWKPPAGLSDKKDIYVMVSFTIFANGTISDVAISHSSGNTTLDQLAGRAIKLAAPFGKFPVGYTDNKLDIDYKLRPEAQ